MGPRRDVLEFPAHVPPPPRKCEAASCPDERGNQPWRLHGQRTPQQQPRTRAPRPVHRGRALQRVEEPLHGSTAAAAQVSQPRPGSGRGLGPPHARPKPQRRGEPPQQALSVRRGRLPEPFRTWPRHRRPHRRCGLSWRRWRPLVSLGLRRSPKQTPRQWRRHRPPQPAEAGQRRRGLGTQRRHWQWPPARLAAGAKLPGSELAQRRGGADHLWRRCGCHQEETAAWARSPVAAPCCRGRFSTSPPAC
mmetsp:Transcript_63507/g.136536  ORF Transcript_63507/g.136536 Transcript_63507/m.136536 type:complete len:248 (-) Transcript_63507:430-1173(-)